MQPHPYLDFGFNLVAPPIAKIIYLCCCEALVPPDPKIARTPPKRVPWPLSEPPYGVLPAVTQRSAASVSKPSAFVMRLRMRLERPKPRRVDPAGLRFTCSER